MNILITGASRGIGYALASAFIDDPNNKVFAISRDTEKLKKLAEETNSNNNKGDLYYLGFDLLSDNYTESLVPSIKNKLGSIDILVNNAGALINNTFDQLSDEDFDTIFNMNVKSPFRLVRDLLPIFNKPAHIVNISSMGGVQGSVKFPGLSLYSASKGALAVLTECLAEELKDREIKVNALAIGAVQTEMLSEAFPGYEAPVQPDEMADFIKIFALTGHQYFNGKILPVSLSTP